MVIESISPEWSVFGKEEVSQKPEQIELGIHPQLRDLLPPLTETEYEKLEKSLLKKGCYDPIKTWRGYILDGHNRYGLCLKHNIPFQVQDCTNDKGLETTQDALLWIIENQQSRRNLKPYQMYVLEGEKQKILVGVGKKGFRSDQWKDLNIKKELRTSPPIGGENTSPYYQIAKNMGMGHNTYTKCKYVDKHGTEEQKKSLNAGKTSLDNIYKKISEEKRIEATEFPKDKFNLLYIESDYIGNELSQLPIKSCLNHSAGIAIVTSSKSIKRALDILKTWNSGASDGVVDYIDLHVVQERTEESPLKVMILASKKYFPWKQLESHFRECKSLEDFHLVFENVEEEKKLSVFADLQNWNSYGKTA